MWPPLTATADKEATDFQNVPWVLVVFPLESLHSLNLFILFFTYTSNNQLPLLIKSEDVTGESKSPLFPPLCWSTLLSSPK